VTRTRGRCRIERGNKPQLAFAWERLRTPCEGVSPLGAPPIIKVTPRAVYIVSNTPSECVSSGKGARQVGKANGKLGDA